MKLIKKHPVFFLVSFFLLLAAFLRFQNLNWDSGNYFHPDERNIAMAVSRIHFFTQMDPQFFAYGGLPIYLYRVVGEGLVVITGDPGWVLGWDKINLIGRFFSALFSTLTVIPLFLLARKIFSLRTAVFSILFYSFAVFSIQTAHYGVTESMITFFVVCIATLSVFCFEKPKWHLFFLLGMTLGLALAAKTAASSFFIYPLFLFLFLLKKRKEKEISFSYLFGMAALTGLTSLVFFLLFSPFTVLSWQKFMESMRYEGGVVQGTLPVPYTLQFNGTPKYLFQLYNFFYQIGPLPLVLLLTPFVLWKEKKIKNYSFLLFLSFPLLYFLYVGSWHTKFIRYMVPFLPFLLILISFTFDYVLNHFKRVGKALFFVFYVLTLLWTYAFLQIYLQPQTRIKASYWIYQHIPEGKVLATEHWDDGLPISLPEHSPSLYTIHNLPIYDLHNPSKVKEHTDTLSSTDYIVINSRRLYGTLIRLDEEYPYASSYYKALFAGKLGFEKVAEFTSYPHLLGFQFIDDYSEETFQVYDHPKVLIFHNKQKLSSEELYDAILSF